MSKEKLKCFKVADVSTLHIAPKDDDILRKHVDSDPEDHPQVIMEYAYGYFVSTWHNEVEESGFKEQLAKLGHTPEYIRLVMKCNQEGCKWLNLDRDGEDYNDLPEFDWL